MDPRSTYGYGQWQYLSSLPIPETQLFLILPLKIQVMGESWVESPKVGLTFDQLASLLFHISQSAYTPTPPRLGSTQCIIFFFILVSQSPNNSYIKSQYYVYGKLEILYQWSTRIPPPPANTPNKLSKLKVESGKKTWLPGSYFESDIAQNQ